MISLRPLFLSLGRRQTPTLLLRPSKPYSTRPPSTAMGPLQSQSSQSMQPSNPNAVLNDLNILSSLPPPLANIDGVLSNGFIFGGSTQIVGERMGVVILGGEVFRWYPFGIEKEEGGGGKVRVGTGRGEEEVVARGDRERWEGAEEEGRKRSVIRLEDREVWGVLDVIWPKPDILVVGTGARNLLISPVTRKLLNDFGVRLEVSDTRNAAANYNLLATERPGMVAAALLPANFGDRISKK